MKVVPAKLTASVVLPKTTYKPEPVSPRLIRSLPHTDRKAILPIVEFNPRGELIVCGYPSGVAQVFDPHTGKELRKIETPRGYRGSFNHVQLSRDQGSLFVALDDSKFEPLRDGEKKTWFRRFTGETRVYDLKTGEQKPPLKVEPRRGVSSLAVSPDGGKVATMELGSGRNEDFDKLRAMYLWDVKTGKATKLRDGYGDTRFAPDGKTVNVMVDDYAKKTGVLYAYSVETGKEVGKVENKDGLWSGLRFSGDGKYAAASATDPKTRKPIVRLYDVATLTPVHAFAPELPEGATGLGYLTFSPDGKRLAAAAKTTVFLWDLGSKKLLRSWPLGAQGRVRHMAFDSTGDRLAASTWHIPPELQNARDEVVGPEDYPQPKAFLLDAAGGKTETIVCPHGYWGRVGFSPDGKMLAVGGAGTVHLFDVSKKWSR